MRSSINSVRSSFIAAIKELGYAVYDRYRKVNDYPYIIVGGITEIQNGAQDRFGQIVTVNIEVYDGWKSDYGIMNRGERIVDAILRKILNNPHTHEIPGFNMPVLTLDNMMSNTEQTETHTLTTTVIRFKMQLFEIESYAQFDYTFDALIQ